jgi:ribosome-associated translation inhibitor RaiA
MRVKQLEIQGLPPQAMTALRAEARVAAALAPVRGALRARVAFIDENGPKGGPAIRCALTVTVPPRGVVHVETQAVNPRLALDGMLGKLERRLERRATARRDARRRPRKYYAARAVTGWRRRGP